MRNQHAGTVIGTLGFGAEASYIPLEVLGAGTSISQHRSL